MKKALAMHRLLFLSCLLGVPTLGTRAQSPKPPTNPPTTQTATANSLFLTITSLDKELFDAVDQCDMKKIDSFWAGDAEFYHDKGGLMVGRQNIVESVKNNLCGKVKRELVPGTLEVYPINEYGAVEIGVHRFLHPWAQDHGVIGEASLWQNKDGRWKITRVISYDRGLAK